MQKVLRSMPVLSEKMRNVRCGRMFDFHKADAVMFDFEKNKRELLNTLQSMHRKNDAAKPQEAGIVVYGADCPFISGLVETLKKQQSLESFENHESAISYCLDNSVNTVILDMDPPTDWKLSTDIFTNIRTMKPNVQFVLLTKSPRSIPVRTLAKQSAAVLQKPFSLEMLLREIKTGVSNNKSI